MEFKTGTIPETVWLSFIECSKFGNPFHGPAYYDAIKNYKNYEGILCRVEKDNDLMALCLISILKEDGIKGIFSKRAIIYGGPVLADVVDNDLIVFFLKNLQELLKNKCIYIEFRNFFDYSSYKDVFVAAGFKYEPYVNVQLPIAGISIKDIHAKFKYNRRREIRQSIDEGCEYFISDDKSEFKEVYSILTNLYKTRVKLPLPSFNFFNCLYESKAMVVSVVKHQNKVIGGAFCLYLTNKNLYTFYYCGLRDYNKKVFPTHLAIWAAIEFAVKNNIGLIDFMGAGKLDTDYGVRKYKLEFGGQLVEHGRFIRVINPIKFNIGKIGLLIITKLKR